MLDDITTKLSININQTNTQDELIFLQSQIKNQIEQLLDLQQQLNKRSLELYLKK